MTLELIQNNATHVLSEFISNNTDVFGELLPNNTTHIFQSSCHTIHFKGVTIDNTTHFCRVHIKQN